MRTFFELTWSVRYLVLLSMVVFAALAPFAGWPIPVVTGALFGLFLALFDQVVFLVMKKISDKWCRRRKTDTRTLKRYSDLSGKEKNELDQLYRSWKPTTTDQSPS